MPNPPPSRIEAVTLHSSQEFPSGRYIPMQFTINTWVILQPDLQSEWGRDSARYAVNSLQYYWKARIISFEHGIGKDLITRVRVRHAYESRQLQLDPRMPQPRLPCNYLFPSVFDDWVDPGSVVGPVVAMHADIGALIHHDRTHRELRDASIFFYKWVYVPPAGHHLYGHLEEIPLPGLSSFTWPLPDMSTSEAFRGKLRLDFRAALKPTTGSHRSHCQWFLPFTVFVDLFAIAKNQIRSATLFTIRNLDNRAFADLMDVGWSSKTVVAEEIIRCTVSYPSVVFRYHIARQTLYVNFFFNRERAVGQEWVPMEHQLGTEIIILPCSVMGSNPFLSLNFNVGTDWPISHLRVEVHITMGQDAPTEFSFVVGATGSEDRKINRRRESTMTVAEVLPPRSLKLRIRDT